MEDNPQPGEWLNWWLLPLRAMSPWGVPPASLAPQMLSQPILPGWTFADTVNVTEENSASPETERQIVSRYSYGRQLGRVLDAVNELIAERPDTAPEPPSIKDFRQLWSDINEIKTQSAVKRVEQALNDLAEMKKLHTEEFNRLAPKWREILEEWLATGRGKSGGEVR